MNIYYIISSDFIHPPIAASDLRISIAHNYKRRIGACVSHHNDTINTKCERNKTGPKKNKPRGRDYRKQTGAPALYI